MPDVPNTALRHTILASKPHSGSVPARGFPYLANLLRSENGLMVSLSAHLCSVRNLVRLIFLPTDPRQIFRAVVLRVPIQMGAMHVFAGPGSVERLTDERRYLLGNLSPAAVADLKRDNKVSAAPAINLLAQDAAWIVMRLLLAASDNLLSAIAGLNPTERRDHVTGDKTEEINLHPSLMFHECSFTASRRRLQARQAVFANSHGA